MADIIDLIEYLKKRSAKNKIKVSLKDIEAFCELDDEAVSWLSTLTAFARYSVFLKVLFHRNRGVTGNRNAGFLVAFSDEQMEGMRDSCCKALARMGRPVRVINAAGKRYIEIVSETTGVELSSKWSASEAMTSLLEDSEDVVFIEAFSRSLANNKSGYLRDWIKTLDDAHLKNKTPRCDLIFLDSAAFLQRVWPSIGPYLTILPYSSDICLA